MCFGHLKISKNIEFDDGRFNRGSINLAFQIQPNDKS